MPGVELGGALKNVLAIGCGISDGLGFGCNGRAALITRGLSEMTRLAVALGAHPLTMQGLAGMGDLVLTCTGALARLCLLADLCMMLQQDPCSCSAFRRFLNDQVQSRAENARSCKVSPMAPTIAWSLSLPHTLQGRYFKA